MLALRLIPLLLSFCLAIYDDEVGKSDWFVPQVGQFVGAPVITSDKCVVGLTATSSLVIIDSSGQFVTRTSVLQDPQLGVFGSNIVLTESQNNLSHTLSVYTHSGDLVEHRSLPGKVAQLHNHRDSKLFIRCTDGTVLVMDKSYAITNTELIGVSFINGTSTVSTEDDEPLILLATNEEVRVLSASGVTELNRIPFKLQQLSADGLALSTSGTVFKFDAFSLKFVKVKTNKAQQIDDLGYIPQSGGRLLRYSESNEMIYEWDDPTVAHQLKDGVLDLIFTDGSVQKVDLETGIVIDESYIPLDDVDSISRITIGDPSTNAVLVEYSNGTMVFYDMGIESWTKDTSLAEIKKWGLIASKVDAKTMRIEHEWEAESFQNIWSAYASRLSRNYHKLASVVSGALRENVKTAAEDLENDVFGFHRKLVALTKSGSLHLFDVESRSKLWSKSYAISSFVLEHDYIVGECSNTLIKIDVDTGEILSTIEIGSGITDTFDVDSFHYFVTSGNEVYSFGPADGAKYIINHDEKSLFGQVIEDGSVTKTWSSPLSAGEKVLSVEKRIDPNNDNVANVGTVLGDRRVLYKYLQPNMVLVSIWDESVSSLRLKLTNVITGETVMVVEHGRDEFVDPDTFQACFDENFIILRYMSYVPSFGQKLVVIDLYESDIPDLRHSSTRNNDTLVPVFYEKSFNFPHEIGDMVITRTRYNIAMKNVVLVLPSLGQIVAIPKYVLNARRPMELGKDNSVMKREFSMMEYQPNLAYAPSAVISNINRLDVSRVEVIETDLESTCIICALGVDIYCTKLSTSGQFDRLGASFDKFMLTLTIAALIGAILVIRPILNKRKLNSGWLN